MRLEVAVVGGSGEVGRQGQLVENCEAPRGSGGKR